MVDTRLGIPRTLTALIFLILLILLAALRLADLTVHLVAEDIEVLNLITETKDPVAAEGLIELDTRHGEVHDTGGAVFELRREVVLERGINTEQRGEGLVDADGRDIIHRRRLQGIRGRVGNESQAVHILLPGAVGGVTADGIDRLIGVVDVDALQMVADPGEFREAGVAHSPVGQHAGDGREDVERIACAHGIGREEGRHEDIGAIGVDIAEGAWGILVLRLHTLLELGDEFTEVVEGIRLIAIGGVAHA